MASKTVQPIAIELGIKGGEKLAALNRSFRDLSKQVKLSDADITQATKDIIDFATKAGNSEATIKGQIKAFEGLREQAALGGKTYAELTQEISKLQSTLRGSSDAVERERSNLVKLGSASKNSAKDLQYVIGQLEKLKSKVREDSAAFLQLGKDIKNLNVNLKEVEISAGKARFAINTILSAKPEKITGQIEKLSAAIASGTLEAEDLNIALRKLELLRVGAGRGPVAFRADVFSSQLGVDYFARLRKEYDNLEKTQAAISQRISEVNTELQNVSGYERRRSLTLELIRLNKELQQSIVNVTTREQFQAIAIRQRMGSARESYAASGFGAFSAEIRQRTAGGEFTPGMQRARERARNEIINEEAVRATTDIFDTWEQAYGRIEDAARGHKTEMARIQAAQGQLLIEKQDRINDKLLRSNQAAYDKEVAEFDARLNRIEKLKSGEFASRQALGLGGGELSSLYGNIVGIGTSYARGQQEMMGRSPIQVFNDITSTFNRDLRRSGDARIEAERQLRDNLVREFGAGSQKLKAALERIPMGQMTTAQLPGAGEDLSAYVRRIETSTRGLEGVLTGFGKKTTNELRQARQSFVLFRDELDPTTASFERLEREAVASISRIDKELEKRQMGRRRGMSPMQMTQAAGAAISGGIFGGPEGFLGGAIGAIGGVGGAFAGAAIGAQVGGLRRQLGEFADYAAGIQKLQIALRGVAGSQSEFNRAMAAASSVTKELNVPQDVAIQGMTRLTAAVKGAGGGVADAELAFKNINSAIIATGGGAEQVEGAVTALVQIFSKGKVSAEEINQIAERLPGTFNKIAEASGRTGPELAKALQDGKVGLNDLMKFLVRLGGDYSSLAEKIAQSSESAGARLQVAYDKMRQEVGKALQPIGAEFQAAFAEFIQDITPELVSAAKAVGDGLRLIIQNREAITVAASFALKLAAVNLALKAFSAFNGPVSAMFTLLRTGFKATSQQAALAQTKLAAFGKTVKALAVSLAAPIVITFAVVGAEMVIAYFNRIKKARADLEATAKKPQGEVFFRSIGGTAATKQTLQSNINDITKNLDILRDRVKSTKKELQSLEDTARTTYGGGGGGLPVEGVTDRSREDLKARLKADEAEIERLKLNYKTLIDRYIAAPDAAAGTTNFPDPITEEKGGAGAARDAERRAEEIARLKRALALGEAKGRIFEIEERIKATGIAIVDAQNQNNFAALRQLQELGRSLEYEKKRAEIVTQYNAKMREIRETSDGEIRDLKERLASQERSLALQRVEVELNAQNIAAQQQLTQLKKEQSKTFEQQFTDRQRELGLISEPQYNKILMARERERLAGIEGLTPEQPQRGLDLYRQEIDPTTFEKVQQNIAQLKKELGELVKPANQITSAATAIGDAFSQSFVDAISGSKTAKEALADFFSSVGSYFLDMAKQIIAKMIQIAILNAVVGLLPGGSGGSPAKTGPVGPIQSGETFNLPGKITTSTFAAANGAYFDGGTSHFANGGIVTRPTFFKYANGGTMQNGLMGEAGPEAIMPLKRGADGKLGVQVADNRAFLDSIDTENGEAASDDSEAEREATDATRAAIRESERIQENRMQIMSQQKEFDRRYERERIEQMASTPGKLDIKYESQVINNVEYVTREQAERMAAQSALRGRELAIGALQNSVKTRKRVGI